MPPITIPLEEFLEPGDVLLYRAKGVFGWIIRIKTWHNVGHCEVYVGRGPDSALMSVASRDGKGVGKYPLRTSELFQICRPKRPFNLEAAMRYFKTVDGEPYGWLDLAAFAGVTKDGPGQVCSAFAVSFQRAGGVNGFNGEPARAIAPFQFDVSNDYLDFKVVNGEVVIEAVPAGA